MNNIYGKAIPLEKEKLFFCPTVPQGGGTVGQTLGHTGTQLVYIDETKTEMKF